MDPYIPVLLAFGILVLLSAWLPLLLQKLPLSLPIACLVVGAAVFALPIVPGVIPHPQEILKLTERTTELVVIISLMGAGLKLDRALTWSTGGVTWRLLAFAMPLTILLLAILGYSLLGLGAAAAVLIASALAPTDPVLASDVQVGPPHEGQEDEVRYALTSEAGLNDGLAFPFVNFAIAIALSTSSDGEWLARWFFFDVIWKLVVGLMIGVTVGYVLAWITFRLPQRARLSRTGDGFVALGITAIAYSVTELAYGYGFLAVFVAALSFRAKERAHDFHAKLHEFTDQLERLLMAVLLILLGGAITAGGLLKEVTWSVVLFAGLALFVVRPAVAYLSLWGRAEPVRERLVISFFGIRGMGSIYYLAYGLGHASFYSEGVLWSAVTLVIVASIFIHGLTVTPVMRFLDAERSQSKSE
jgi:NhaP-type Na+/H+ or K+/H+ antiporter